MPFLDLPFQAEDAIWYRRGRSAAKCFTLDDDPYSRGEMVRHYLEHQVEAGDVFYSGRGEYFFGRDRNLLLQPGVGIKGPGAAWCRWKSEVVSDNSGTAFCLTDSVIEDLALEVVPWKNEDSRLVGFDPDNQMALSKPPRPIKSRLFRAAIRRCALYGSDWTIYNWTDKNSYLRVEDCTAHGSRIVVAAAARGAGPLGTGSQRFDLLRCHFYADGGLSKSVGATSHRTEGLVAAVLARSGRVRVLDCTCQLVGHGNPGPDSWGPRVAGITDWIEAEPSEHLRLEVRGFISEVAPGPTAAGVTPEAWDVDLRRQTTIDKLRWGAGGWGSGEGGKYLCRQPVKAIEGDEGRPSVTEH